MEDKFVAFSYFVCPDCGKAGNKNDIHICNKEQPKEDTKTSEIWNTPSPEYLEAVEQPAELRKRIKERFMFSEFDGQTGLPLLITMTDNLEQFIQQELDRQKKEILEIIEKIREQRSSGEQGYGFDYAIDVVLENVENYKLNK